MANTMVQESDLIVLLNSPGYALLRDKLQQERNTVDFGLHKADPRDSVAVAKLQQHYDDLTYFITLPQSMLKDLQHPKGE